MQAWQLIALLQNIPGDTEVLVLTPSEDDGDGTYHDIANSGFINRDDAYTLVVTPQIHGMHFTIPIENDEGDNDD